ncbi:hypothetical protein K469DRAFT_695833 [Zopfia rhizophila CBS 207.26]|uniref:Uncharacterized protein n=1 Tax=Zopfia rhizophila CBS 207.26 TaxID=1314779 RepID=A0A6A6EHZ6_9PEZI|nr:hypothetical protein K469DRAFT_695833 [Zopfia rhizophila CBS 207.26]
MRRNLFGNNAISEMSEDVDLSTPPKDGMSLTEKMARFYDAEHPDFPPEPTPVDQQLDEVQVPPRYQEVRSFLLEGPAYQWLLENARSSALLTKRKGAILEAVTREIDATLSSIRTPKSWRSRVFQANFDVDWDLPNFLRDQRYDTALEIAVERAITVTGSSSNAQALSCMDYMCQTWPSSSRQVTRVLQEALISPNLSCSSCIVDRTELNINLRSPKASIVAHGSQAALTGLCEQLAWLGAALRTSLISFGICLSTPIITASKDACSSNPVPSITVHLGFTVTPSPDHGPSTDVDGTCWHAMFRKPVVVNGFPILARHENEQGLELPLDIISILAEAHFATRYDTVLALKGHCTMLVHVRTNVLSLGIFYSTKME